LALWRLRFETGHQHGDFQPIMTASGRKLTHSATGLEFQIALATLGR